jgi:hypothetical protein
MDYPTLRTGPDERVPPGGNSEGHACRARRNGIDRQTVSRGPNKQVPPRGGRDEGIPPRGVKTQPPLTPRTRGKRFLPPRVRGGPGRG